MSNTAIALRALLTWTALAAFCWSLIALVRHARRAGKGARAMGAMLMLFSWGNMRDPRNDTVAEAKDGRIRKGNHAGDPLDKDAQ